MATVNWIDGGAGDGFAAMLASTGLVASMSEQLQRLREINDALSRPQADLGTLARGNVERGAGDGGGSVLGTIGSYLGGGFGVTPLISGLVDLFSGGSDAAAPPPFVPYFKPAPVRLDAGISAEGGSTPFALDFAQGGSPRPVSAAPAQITVQVNAMDSRSFLDHSDDIARAVRRAMLETTVLNDVIREV